MRLQVTSTSPGDCRSGIGRHTCHQVFKLVIVSPTAAAVPRRVGRGFFFFKLEKFAEPIAAEIIALAIRIPTLRQTRDLLLPKLLSAK